MENRFEIFRLDSSENIFIPFMAVLEIELAPD